MNIQEETYKIIGFENVVEYKKWCALIAKRIENNTILKSNTKLIDWYKKESKGVQYE